MTESKLKLGDPAPEFELRTTTATTSSSPTIAASGSWCTFTPRTIPPAARPSPAASATTIWPSKRRTPSCWASAPTAMQSHQKFKTKFNLPFTLLSDDDHAVAETYGVWGEKSMMGKTYMGVIRSHFVIDENGKLIDVQYNIKPEASVAGAIQVISR